jgi:predicted heme/steroid binding protein/uncharacterized membrane protein
MKEFDLLSLSEMDGREGRPVFVVYQGKVYDVSSSKLWKGGLHMRLHQAGRDLSAGLPNAPHGEETLQKFPIVGILNPETKPAASEEAGGQMPKLLNDLLSRYPFLRRHPHPMVVHFPIVLYLSCVFFNFLYLATKDGSFEQTAIYCLVGAILSMPVAMFTGFLTWWLNYSARPMTPITMKINLSCILLAVSIGVLSWRMAMPTALPGFRPTTLAYLLLVLVQAPLVSAIGWYGASLTFPLEKD